MNTAHTNGVLDGKKIVLTIPNLNAGGAQKIALLVASELLNEGAIVVILVQNPDPYKSVHVIPPGVQTKVVEPETTQQHLLRLRLLQRCRSIFMNSRLMMVVRTHAIAYLSQSTYSSKFKTAILSLIAHRRLYGKISRLQQVFLELNPDVVVSFLTTTNILTLLAVKDRKFRLIVCERNDPEKQLLSPELEALRAITYRQADVVTVNSPVRSAVAVRYFGVENAVYLPNPITRVKDSRTRQPSRRLAYVGRLVAHKRVDLLVQAFYSAFHKGLFDALDIVGDGPELPKLMTKVNDLGLSKVVNFLGYVSDPSIVVGRSRFLILPSEYEGTPNAVLEAFAQGIPAICSSGSPGPVSLVSQIDEGLIFQSGSLSGLIDVLVYADKASFLYQEMSMRSIEVAKSHLWVNVRDKWMDTLVGNESSP